MYQQIPKDTAVVQKYGGTSVGSAERIKAVAQRIARQVNAGYHHLAIVVSARSGETNRLVDLVREVNPKASGLSYDLPLAAGEQVSVALMCAALEAEKIKSRPLMAYKLGIFTDSLHSKARIREIKTTLIQQAWQKNEIPVIAGFQGITDDLEITTLGRGGSDTSAVALAAALQAGFCEINTDVDGVYTCDPRIVPEARLINVLDFETALEMASLGSKVLHPRCVELGAKFNLPIVVRNSFKSDDHQRTKIMSSSSRGEAANGFVKESVNGKAGSQLESLVVSGITVDRSVAKITVTSAKKDGGLIAATFVKMADLGVNVDIIIHNRPDERPSGDARMHFGFTVGRADVDVALNGLEDLMREHQYDLTIETETGLAKVSAVGVGMQSYAGVAGRVFQALTAEEIDIHMISTSEIKISCVVGEQMTDAAARALHKAFIETL